MFFSMKRKVVFVAMSGGVDSSVAALLLQRRGFEVVGVFMKNWSQNIPGTVVCSTEEDQRYARHVASQLRIPFYSWDFEKEYREFVFEPMVRAYTQGLTPNPDVACNQHIKFGVFFEKAMSLGADYIATGHYVGKTKNFFNNEDILRTAKDKNKDQSYFLWTLSQDKLKHCFFPIGSYQKSTVRAIARSGGLVTADKKDSQGLCFVGQVDFSRFLGRHIPDRKGEVIAVDCHTAGGYHGRVIGAHEGLHFFTLGQRQGIRIGGGVPYYVAGKDAKTNRLYVSPYDCARDLFPVKVSLGQCHFISARRVEVKKNVLVRHRYRQPLRRAIIYIGSGKRGEARFAEPPFGIASGQSLVFYQGNTMLGGAVIEPFAQDWMRNIVI